MTLEDFKTLLATTLKLKSVDLGESLDKTPGWDSLNHLHLLMALESTAGISIPAEMYGELTTARALVSYLEENQALEAV
jgi:acyl carrier protein